MKADLDMSAWDQFGLDSVLIRALRHLGFPHPTEIQAKTLPAALQQRRDILGAAETGSGKTFAFALPIIQLLLQEQDSAVDEPSVLILTPTRELAIQVRDHIDRLCRFAPNINTVAIVGGMSVANQQRLLRRKPAIIIATPGRLWELITNGEPYLIQLRRSLRYLVIDEADRMLEKGHFKDLGNLMDYLNGSSSTSPATDELNGKEDGSMRADGKLKRQTFVFSATLTRHFASKKRESTAAADDTSASEALAAMIERIHFRDKRPCLIDLTTKQVLAHSLSESRVDCLQTEKDVYLYYFLSRYPGRTIVFVNSISCIRRLVPIISLLGFQVYGLHAQMQQRQRLKNLDR
jgi:ATP-dependent RNA helicase DDX24/MAK5